MRPAWFFYRTSRRRTRRICRTRPGARCMASPGPTRRRLTTLVPLWRDALRSRAGLTALVDAGWPADVFCWSGAQSDAVADRRKGVRGPRSRSGDPAVRGCRRGGRRPLTGTFAAVGAGEGARSRLRRIHGVQVRRRSAGGVSAVVPLPVAPWAPKGGVLPLGASPATQLRPGHPKDRRCRWVLSDNSLQKRHDRIAVAAFRIPAAATSATPTT